MGWLELLKKEVAASNITQVATRLGYSRTTISLVLSGAYDGSLDQVAEKVVEVLGQGLLCPHLSEVLSEEECQEFHSRPIPQSNARELRHWRACQSCPIKAKAEETAHVA